MPYLENASSKSEADIGTHGPRVSICKVLIMSDSLSSACSVWGAFSALCKIADVKIFKRLLHQSFHQILTNFYVTCVK